MDTDGGNKTQRVRCRPNYVQSKLIVGKGLRNCGEERTQITLSSSTTIGHLARIQGRHGLQGSKNCQQYQD